jgi:hypothetical protein
MLAFLRQVRERHGSITDLLLGLGLSPATLDDLGVALLEP